MPDASTQTSPQPCFNPFASTPSCQRPAMQPSKPRRRHIKPKGKPVFTVTHGCFTLFGPHPQKTHENKKA